MLLLLLRIAYVAMLLGTAAISVSMLYEYDGNAVVIAPIAILGIGSLVIATDVWEKNKQITTVSAVYFGMLLGLLLGYLFSLAIAPIVDSSFPNTKMALLTRVLISVVCCYVTISTFLQTKDEFRFIIPYVEFSKQTKGGRPLVLDTSVIIDGRIADVCDTRLIDTKLIIPRFVLQELQAVADSNDRLKRNRGRRGLGVLKRLQSNPKLELEIHDGNVPELRTGERIRVDERLVIFAKSLNARVVTNDFNLNKVAQLQGVDVINLNELANALKTVALPGEFMNVRVVKAGDQMGQGVGYLDDGTMVVVEQGRNLIGQEVGIVVTSVLQTPAGRMIFGRPDNRASGSHTPLPGSSTSTNAPAQGTGTAPPVTGNESRTGGTAPRDPQKGGETKS